MRKTQKTVTARPPAQKSLKLLRAPALLFPVRETSQDCGLRTAEGGYDRKLCTRSAHLRTLLDVEFDSLDWLAIVPGVE
jgi:hypothetical protein